MKLSPYFDSDEFECHDGTDVPAELIMIFDRDGHHAHIHRETG